jgi:ribosomal protein S18 acetylase RimI-like enzyme
VADEELERIHVFLDENDRAAASRIEPFPWGRAILHDRLPLVYDLNFLYVEHGEPTAPQLAAEAERIQRAAGHTHRKVVAGGPGVDRLAPGFAELGWSLERLVVMPHRRAPDRARDLGAVEEVGHAALRPVWEAGLRAVPAFRGRDDLVSQLLEHRRVVADSVPTRYFAARADGAIASYCELYSRDGVAQIESVTTLPGHRNRGLAGAVVLRALSASREAGADLTFLVAEAADWPRHLYARLGFEEIGGYGSFTLTRPGA